MPITFAQGGAQYDDRFEPLDARLIGTITTASFVSNSVYLVRFRVSKAFTASKIAIFMGATAAGNIDLGIYTSPDFTTYTKVASTGSVAAPTINLEGLIALTAAYTVVPGVDYWFGFGITDGTITVLRGSIFSALGLTMHSSMVKASAWSSGLPATLTGLAGNNPTPWFALVK